MSSAEGRRHELFASAGDVHGEARLMTGQPVRIDRAGPADLEAVRGFYARLGDASTYYRFFGLRRHIPEGELLGVVGESAHHVTLLASIGPELIGIGEFIVGKQPTEAEVAFAVADDHHREGVATLLLERLAVIAHDRGLLRFTATVMPGNADMQLVFRTVGLAVSSRFDDGVVEIVLELASLTSLAAASDARAGRPCSATPSPIAVTTPSPRTDTVRAASPDPHRDDAPADRTDGAGRHDPARSSTPGS